MERRTCVKLSVLASLGLVILLVGGVVLWHLPCLVQSKVGKALNLEEDGPAYSNWVETPVPIYMRVFFFNITNPGEILQGLKPRLKEVGPFTYRETRNKYIKSLDLQNHTITYAEKRTYYFIPDLSVAGEDAVIITPNIPLLTASKLTRELEFVERMIASRTLDAVTRHYGERLFVSKSVGSLLFHGYLVKPLEYMTQNIGPYLPSGRSSFLPNNIFGYFHPLNGSYTKWYTVHTGAPDGKQFTLIKSYSNQTSLNIWNNPYCNMINGTDGLQFPPFVKKDSKLFIFNEELCRSFTLEFVREEFVSGILTYRFQIPTSIYEASHANLCFCVNKRRCLLNGVLDISRCKRGAPLVTSTPHFIYTHQRYQESVEGLEPDPSQHTTFLNIEPETGFVLSASKRVQINVEMTANKGLEVLKNAPDMVFPVFWIDESAKVTPEKAVEFSDWVLRPQVMMNEILTGIIILGVILLLVTSVMVTILAKPSLKNIIMDRLGKKEIHPKCKQ